jgi:RimJ/RimL family protein N-acetyltransferase
VAVPDPAMHARLTSARLLLEPLTDDVQVAAEMVSVLSDPVLYLHTGGEPPDVVELRARFARQSRGASPDGHELWFNWIVRTRSASEAVGFLQVSLVLDTGVADLAWVIGMPFQRRGYATEAARVVVEWLASRPEARCVTAHIARANVTSQRVAKRLDLTETTRIEDGEVVWEARLRA